jgi:hypothetical protein
MLRTFKSLLTAESQSLSALCGGEITRCNGILLQAPMANAATAYFGERGREFAELISGGSAGIDVNNIKDVFVKGDPLDYLIVVIY